MTTGFGREANERLLHELLGTEQTEAALSGSDAVDWLSAMAEGRISAEELTRACLARMARWEKHLNAMISLAPDAPETARACDRLRAAGVVKPLLGLPVVVKDNIDVAGFPTTVGAAALQDGRPKRDAFLVSLLREAGAVILGKTNLSEYASDGMTESSLIGQTRNPYDLTRTPGGSSGGSGAATAAEYAAVAVGTDGVNSVRSPASANALVGLRPTRGLVSRRGVCPCSETQDMCGTLTRSARDAALLLGVLARHDPLDPASVTVPVRDYLAGLRDGALAGRHLVLLRNNCGDHPAVTAMVRRTAARLRRLGATVEETEDAVLDAGRLLREDNVIRYEQKANIDRWLSDPENGYRVRSLQEYLDSGLIPAPVAATLRAELTPQYLDRDAYRRRLDRIAEDRRYVVELMEARGIDAFCYPSQTIPVAPVGAPGGQAGRTGILASALGLPAVSFPGGYTEPTADAPVGVPMGMELLGAPFSEQTLLGMTHDLERAEPVRKIPPLERLR